MSCQELEFFVKSKGNCKGHLTWYTGYEKKKKKKKKKKKNENSCIYLEIFPLCFDFLFFKL